MTGSGAADPHPVTVLVCAAGPSSAGGAALARGALDLLPADGRRSVGTRPGKQIDPLLAGRVVVVGDDADLAAVVLRLVRRDLLAEVEIGYVPGGPTDATHLWGLPADAPRQARAALSAGPREVPLVRDDAGGVLLARGRIGPLDGPVYVDEHRVLGGPAHELVVVPDRARGLAITVTLAPRRIPLLGRRPVTTLGRAVQVGTTPATVVRDGVEFPRQMTRWTWYRHTRALRLAAP